MASLIVLHAAQPRLDGSQHALCCRQSLGESLEIIGLSMALDPSDPEHSTQAQ